MPSMQNLFNPMAGMYQAQLEASRQFADAVFSGTEKIDQVLREAAHRAVTEQLKFAQSLVTVRDAQGVANVQTTYFSQRPDRAMDYQRELARAFTEVQAELGKSLRNYMEQLTTSAASGATATLGAGNGQPGAGYDPLKSIFSVWESAFRDMTSLASQNMAATRNTFDQAAKEGYTNVTAAADETVEAMTAGREKNVQAGSSTKH